MSASDRSPVVATTERLLHRTHIIMAAVCNRAGHYIFALWFLLSSFFPSPNLSGRKFDVYRTSAHGVALVRI